MEILNKMSDEQLVRSYIRGNNQAFDVLLSRYENKLFSYIFFIVHNRDVADDIFQETFVKAIVTLQSGKYTEQSKFSAWITRIAHNLIIDFFRQEHNENVISNDETEVDLFNNANLAEPNVESRMVADQTLSDVQRMMNFLPDNQREVVYMRYYRDMSFREIADATGVSINTALGRMRYALLNLRRMAKENNVVLTLD
jgi:RNA polymerase sigma factor (sigma-70 family)